MIGVNSSVMNLMEKVRGAIKNGRITAENFPLEDILSLIEDTMGNSFWNCVGRKNNQGFAGMPQIYGECLLDALSRKDMMGCERILRLFQTSYLAFYTAMAEDEKAFRQRPYRKRILELGAGGAQLQARLHMQRQSENREIEDMQLGEGKGVVYTFLSGVGEPQQPSEVNRELEYLCFTDQKDRWGKQNGVWKYQPIENPEQLEKRQLKYKYMIMAHKILSDYDYSIWIDPTIRITGDLLNFSRIYGGGHSFLGFLQTRDDCIYQDTLLTDMVDDDINISIRKRMLQYQKEGYPEYNGLLDSRVMIRKHREEKVCRVMEEWWQECRDSGWLCEGIFNYSAWKQGYLFSISNLFLDDNIYFKNSEMDLDINDDYY